MALRQYKEHNDIADGIVMRAASFQTCYIMMTVFFNVADVLLCYSLQHCVQCVAPDDVFPNRKLHLRA